MPERSEFAGWTDRLPDDPLSIRSTDSGVDKREHLTFEEPQVKRRHA